MAPVGHMVRDGAIAPPHHEDQQFISQRAGAVAQQAILESQRVAEGRHFAAYDHGVIPGIRRGRDALVPDLAEAGILPADQMIRGLRRARRGKCGESNAGDGAESKKYDASSISCLCNTGLSRPVIV
jgi:hypothetical protein